MNTVCYVLYVLYVPLPLRYREGTSFLLTSLVIVVLTPCDVVGSYVSEERIFSIISVEATTPKTTVVIFTVVRSRFFGKLTVAQLVEKFRAFYAN